MKNSSVDSVQRMVQAIRTNDRGALGALLDQGGDANAVDAQAWPLALLASLARHYGLVELLLQRGADVDQQAPQGQSLLSSAVEGRAPLAHIRWLLENGADTTACGPRGNILHIACRVNDQDPALLAVLLDAGAAINATTDWNLTPLMEAIQYGQLLLVPLLLARGADVHVADRTQTSTLMFAARRPDGATVRQLVAAGAQLEACDYAGYTALVHAAWLGNDAAVCALVEAGAKLDVAHGPGMRVLHTAARCCSASTVALLLRHGADPLAQDGSPQGRVAARHAALSGRVDTAKVLAAAARYDFDPVAGAQLVADASSGVRARIPELYARVGCESVRRRALFAAIEHKHLESAGALLAQGLEPNFVHSQASLCDGPSTWTPLMSAVAADSLELVERLLLAGASPNLHRDAAGVPAPATGPLYVALGLHIYDDRQAVQWRVNPAMVRRLFSHGANPQELCSNGHSLLTDPAHAHMASPLASLWRAYQEEVRLLRPKSARRRR